MKWISIYESLKIFHHLFHNTGIYLGALEVICSEVHIRIVFATLKAVFQLWLSIHALSKSQAEILHVSIADYSYLWPYLWNHQFWIWRHLRDALKQIISSSYPIDLKMELSSYSFFWLAEHSLEVHLCVFCKILECKPKHSKLSSDYVRPFKFFLSKFF